MRPKAPRTAARERKNKKFLDEYRAMFPWCQCSEGCGLAAWQIHEICGGSHRQKAREHRSCILHLSGPCHARIQGEPYEKGLARKLLADPEFFDRLEFLGVIGRAETAITMPEIVRHLTIAG